MTIERFNPAILNSFESLSHYLSGEEEVRAIVETPRQAGPVLSNWEIVWICIKLPFECLAYLILASLSELYSKFGYSDLAKRCKILSSYLFYDYQMLRTQILFGEKFIARSFAGYNPACDDIYLQPSIEPGQLQDERVKEVAFADYPTEFYHEQGVCRGLGIWFFHIFSRLGPYFGGDLEGRIRAAARVLEKGAGVKAGLVHALYDPERELFNMRIRALFCMNQNNFTDHETGIALLQSCPRGGYLVNFESHFLPFIKTEEGGIIIDPAFGIFKFDTIRECYEYLMQYWANEQGPSSPGAYISVDTVEVVL
jgi:hypothetical protein